MRYSLENRKNKKLYHFLYECIRNDILSGKLKSGSKLPSRREMAKDNLISETTVINAYEQLMLEGYIKSKEKSGYYVTNILPIENVNKDKSEYPKFYVENSWMADFRANDTLYNNFPFATWKKVIRETISEFDNELIRRGNMFGADILRKEIADYLYQSRNIKTSPECVVIGSSIEYFYERIIKMAPHQARFAVENPGYQKIPSMLRNFNVNCEIIDMNNNGIDMYSLRENDVNVVHVSPEHHYPTGIIMSAKRRQELLEWANDDPHRYIIEDDYDCEFRYQYHSISALKSMDTKGRVIYMNTFSKTMSPSIRISYMVLPETLIHRFIATTNFYTNSTSTLEQYAMAKFLKDGYFRRHVNRMKKYYQKEDKLLREALLSNPMIPIKELSPFATGTHLLVKLDTDIPDQSIKKHAAKQKINIPFLTDFCLKDHEKYEHTMILNYSDLALETLEKAVEGIGNCFISGM